jgi:N-glycosylase/DNA lyase
MVDSSVTLQDYSFEIPDTKVSGPMNLLETVLSAQTSEPEWVREGDSFTDVEVFGETPVKYTVSQTGTADRFALKVRALTASPNEPPIDYLKQHLEQVLGLKDDIVVFYREFSRRNDPLKSTFPKLRGLRLMRGTNLYEGLICSMLSQNNSARLWNRTARLMMQYYGRRVSFPDGSISFLFPNAERLAKLDPREFQSMTSMGYRARPVVEVSRMITSGDFSLEALANLSYDEALGRLIELPGVGPKVADCYLLYGAGRLGAAPVDVWIHRIVSKLYFGRRKVSRLKTGRFLRERYGEWAGYAQLYLFDYARRVKPLVPARRKH